MKRFCLVVALAVSALLVPLQTLQAPLLAGPEMSEQRECVVYVTRTGTRYHVDGCRYLRQSRIPMAKRDAIRAGYTACRVCGGSEC
jgi:hypothetical protein